MADRGPKHHALVVAHWLRSRPGDLRRDGLYLAGVCGALGYAIFVTGVHAIDQLANPWSLAMTLPATGAAAYFAGWRPRVWSWLFISALGAGLFLAVTEPARSTLYMSLSVGATAGVLLGLTKAAWPWALERMREEAVHRTYDVRYVITRSTLALPVAVVAFVLVLLSADSWEALGHVPVSYLMGIWLVALLTAFRLSEHGADSDQVASPLDRAVAVTFLALAVAAIFLILGRLLVAADIAAAWSDSRSTHLWDSTRHGRLLTPYGRALLNLSLLGSALTAVSMVDALSLLPPRPASLPRG